MNDIADLERFANSAAHPAWCARRHCLSEHAPDAAIHEGQLAEGGPVSVELASVVALTAHALDEAPAASVCINGEQVASGWSPEHLRAAARVLTSAADRMEETLGS